MPTVRYDDRSYILDGRRIWLSSGSIHYFRVPRELWRDRLLKARRAGLNCIETYVAWNVHEAQEGRWDFNGEGDVAEFITQAAEMGLYVILRPGPYICAEWDFGGFPAWLAVKSGVTFRAANAAYMHYFDKYLGQLLPPLADLQVTRGGNIILIQNENEYRLTSMPDRVNYCQFISQLFRRAGFDIPIITCNHLSEPQIPGTIECYNGYGDAVEVLKRLRVMQPRAPMLATEFRAGRFDRWGGRHEVRDPRDVARRALEIIGCGCQVNYYMWHGGTNFGFRGSRLNADEAAYQTTSYDYDAPLAEGGGLTEKYYLTKLVNMLAAHFGQVLAQSRMVAPEVTVHSGTQVLNLTGPGGGVAVVTNNGRDEITTAEVSLPDGRRLDVSLEPLGATAICFDVRLSGEAVLDYANVMPLGLFGEGNLVLHGPAGWEARVCINGRELRRRIAGAEKVQVIEHAGQRVVLLSSELAQRSWEVDGSLVIGPAFVGETVEDVTPAPGPKQYAILDPAGEVTHRKFKAASARKPTAPRLRQFARVTVSPEPINDELTWRKLDRPRDMAAHGVCCGYGWYRLELKSPRAVRCALFLPDCEDRALVYVNGQPAGVWGRGPDAAREPMPVALKRGPNVLTFLVDNLGRKNAGEFGGTKGLRGQAWEAKPLRLKKFRVKAGGQFSRRMIPRLKSNMLPALEREQMWTAEVTFPLPQICPAHLSYTHLPYHVLVLCNGRQAGFFPNDGGYAQVTLGNELRKGTNRLTLLIWGGLEAKELDNVKLHLLGESISAGGKWSFRKWQTPGDQVVLKGKGLPAWYRSEFKCTPAAAALFLKILSARKGQIYLNGHNLGRFWNIGPQEYYYLPEPYLTEENELLIFEESGSIPSGSRLVYRPGGPYHN